MSFDYANLLEYLRILLLHFFEREYLPGSIIRARVHHSNTLRFRLKHPIRDCSYN